MGASAQGRGNGPQARTGSSPHDLLAHHGKAALSEGIESVAHGAGPPSFHWGGPASYARGAHGLCHHVEYRTVADAVIETYQRFKCWPCWGSRRYDVHVMLGMITIGQKTPNWAVNDLLTHQRGSRPKEERGKAVR